jgi:hypothetical protein
MSIFLHIENYFRIYQKKTFEPYDHSSEAEFKKSQTFKLLEEFLKKVRLNPYSGNIQDILVIDLFRNMKLVNRKVAEEPTESELKDIQKLSEKFIEQLKSQAN